MRIAIAAVVLLGACLSVVAQEFSGDLLRNGAATETSEALTLQRPDIFSRSSGGSLLMYNQPALTLLNGRRISAGGELGRTGWPTLDVVPLGFVSRLDVEKFGGSPRYGSDARGGVVNLITKRYEFGGEVGMFYGRSTGKHGCEDFSAYITTGIGNEHFNLTVGAAYFESDVRVPDQRVLR